MRTIPCLSGRPCCRETKYQMGTASDSAATMAAVIATVRTRKGGCRETESNSDLSWCILLGRSTLQALQPVRHRVRPRAATARQGLRVPSASTVELAASIEDEFLAPALVRLQRLLLGFLQQKRLEHQNVHVGAHEAAVGIFRRADDWLASDVERGVDDDRTTGSAVERLDDVVVGRVCVAAYCLNSRRVIDVRNG